MALDGVLLSGLINELNDTIIPGRIDKIYQPEKDELHIIIRSKGTNFRLLISASANYPRIHITEHNKTNPLTPPTFCMLLRKHLIGGRLISLNQPSFERIVELTFEVITEMGDVVERKLIVEIMGRHSNIILINGEDEILDSIKHISGSISRIRQVMPGLSYVYPPSRGKLDPRKYDKDALLDKLKTTLNKKPADAIMNTFNGISKITATEIVYRAIKSEKDKISYDELVLVINSFYSFFLDVKNNYYSPNMVLEQDIKPTDILPFKYNVYSQNRMKEYESFSKMLEDYYITKDRFRRIFQLTSNLRKLVKTNLARCKKKHDMYIKELENAKLEDKYRLYGELITANIYNISAGVESVTVINYHDPDNKMLDIPLDPSKTPPQNAQMYFKLASKANTVITKVSKLLDETKEEIIYLESLSEALSRVTSNDEIHQIKEELIKEGYIRKRTKKSKVKTTGENRPLHYLSSEGYEIFVGKNNTQNDILTLKMASNNDIWLHTKNMPGSHVIIKTKGKQIPNNTLNEAAILAAYHSKGRMSENVPVDYCPKKNVKKPRGSKPGMVIYGHHNTLYVTPSEDIKNKLQRLN